MTTQTPAGYAYIRHSTKRQGGDDKDSVTRQKESIRALAEHHKVEIPDENFFYENGVSAYSGKNLTHGKLKDLIDQIASLRIRPGDYVFVESIDRLSRQRLLQAKELVNGILEKGIILVTTIDNQRYEKASDINGIDDLSQDILLSVISKRAHEESRTKSIRRKSAWAKAKNSADETQKIFNKNRPPFGVQYNPITDRFEPHPEQAAELNRVFESLRLQGVTATIKEINKTSSVKWTQNRVKDILEKKYPLGYMYSQVKKDGKMVFDKYIENYYPQIISFELFEQARQAMKSRKVNRRVGRASQDNSNIFRHTARCGICGESMFFMNNFGNKTKRYFYMSCRSNFEQENKCKNRFRYDSAVAVLLHIIGSTFFWDYLSKKPALFEAAKKADFYVSNAEGWKKESPQEMDNYSRLGQQFMKFLEGNNENKITHKEKVEKEIIYSKKKMTLENLEKSVESITDGTVPALIMKMLMKAEEDVAKAKEELEILTVNSVDTSAKLAVKTVDDFIDLFKTEHGRLEIINFLASNGMTFFFEFEKSTKNLKTNVAVHKEVMATYNMKTDIDALQQYGFGNLGEEFKLMV
ncbi:hypothetical protein AU074_13590 [Pseudomonas sp. ATCC PTA-122608]|uniref:recombinase family protein n=1 Tax=Pseudomonas sp. ATCC PTA-122608 TaxID=1771311 RepID=UPI00096B832D|nr:recombinase family protein [Pseudomonas sp. ATCC PTA-122608]OLY72203.1 hypothetical protein AU074_13590 [Pseudomonas sp. ATCC PTA-122608]